MKVEIDTKNKTIILKEQCTVQDLIDLLELYKMSTDFTIIPEIEVETEFIFQQPNTYPQYEYFPLYPPPVITFCG